MLRVLTIRLRLLLLTLLLLLLAGLLTRWCWSPLTVWLLRLVRLRLWRRRWIRIPLTRLTRLRIHGFSGVGK